MNRSYDGYLLDAYGVFWAGNAKGLIPGAKEWMEQALKSGKRVGIISNATQLGEREVAKVAKAGLLLGVHFDFYLTSGDIIRSVLLRAALPFPTPQKSYYLVCGSHPTYQTERLLFEGTVYQKTDRPDEADFLYLAVPHIEGEDQLDPELFATLVKDLAAYKKPVLCANPDHFAHEGDPPRAVVRQGALAALFEKEGATVYYYGKPSAPLFLAGLDKLNLIRERVLMVGDTPETDIRGATAAGIDSALITETGISKGRRHFSEKPTYLFPCLSSIPI